MKWDTDMFNHYNNNNYYNKEITVFSVYDYYNNNTDNKEYIDYDGNNVTQLDCVLLEISSIGAPLF